MSAYPEVSYVQYPIHADSVSDSLTETEQDALVSCVRAEFRRTFPNAEIDLHVDWSVSGVVPFAERAAVVVGNEERLDDYAAILDYAWDRAFGAFGKLAG